MKPSPPSSSPNSSIHKARLLLGEPWNHRNRYTTTTTSSSRTYSFQWMSTLLMVGITGFAMHNDVQEIWTAVRQQQAVHPEPQSFSLLSSTSMSSMSSSMSSSLSLTLPQQQQVQQQESLQQQQHNQRRQDRQQNDDNDNDRHPEEEEDELDAEQQERLHAAVAEVAAPVVNLAVPMMKNVNDLNTYDAPRPWTQQQQPQQQQYHYWHNQYNVVHVVHTRFMQLQPNLWHLGQARLDLFRTITIPSMVAQTTHEFVWLIRTDPALDGRLLQELRRLLVNVPNAVLVLSNQNDNDIRHVDNGILEPSKQIVTGSYDLVQSYHQASLSHVVLETRLDADDALAVNFLESIQKRVAQRMGSLPTSSSLSSSSFSKTKNKKAWMVLCSMRSLEWQFHSPWSTPTTASVIAKDDNNKENEVLSSSSQKLQQQQQGAILYSNKDSCITPGLTLVFDVDATVQDLTTPFHHLITKRIAVCSKEALDETNCREKISFHPDTLIFRARTPTSAGMEHVLMTDDDSSTQKKTNKDPKQVAKELALQQFHEQAWADLPSRFGMSVPDLVQVRSNLLQHLPDIVNDALQGQCTQHHSCKQYATDQLKELQAKIIKSDSSPSTTTTTTKTKTTTTTTK
ncbi:hypothetical protein ACA910_010949 [Epithemia clementina (nom. ined.)]